MIIDRFNRHSRKRDAFMLRGPLAHLGYDWNCICTSKTEFSFEENDTEAIWHVRQENIHAAMETEVHCLKKDMLLINYEAPDGKKLHNRLWNGGNGWGTVKLYDKIDDRLELVDEI